MSFPRDQVPARLVIRGWMAKQSHRGPRSLAAGCLSFARQLARRGRGVADGRLWSSKGSAVYSFDVFDTLLTRRYFRPADLFLEAGRRLLDADLVAFEPEAWGAKRVAAEARCRALTPSREVSLADIYAILAGEFSWSVAQSTAAMQIELDCEAQSVLPIAETIQKISDLRSQDASIIFISDTYLPENTVRHLAALCDVSVDIGNLFVSVQHQASKRTGDLFKVAAAALGVSTRDLTHFGDNLHSDVVAASGEGVTAYHFSNQVPTRHEAQFYDMSEWPLLMRSIVAGAARAARLAGYSDDTRKNAIQAIGANVAGPLLFGFVLWILVNARELGIRRLYFVARDGQILQRIATSLAGRLGWEIDCRYLYGSRQAFHKPSLTSIDDRVLNLIVPAIGAERIRDMVDRICLTPDEVQSALSGEGPDGWDARVTATHVAGLRRALAEGPLGERVLARSAALRSVATRYFRQEGLLDDIVSAMVDIGWHGKLQQSLTSILSAAGRPVADFTGFYLCLLNWPDGRFGRFHAYLGEDSASFSRPINGSLLETFCAADHGSVKGYAEAPDGTAVPSLVEPVNGSAIEWGLGTLQDAIVAFSDIVGESIVRSGKDPKDWIPFLRAAGVAAAERFINDPDRSEAEAMGSFRHAEGQTHTHFQEIGPVLDRRERLLAVLAPGLTRYRGHWIEGSMRRSCATTMGGGALLGLFKLRRSIGDVLRTLHRRL